MVYNWSVVKCFDKI